MRSPATATLAAVTAVLATAVTGVVVPASPAAAAASCSGSTGVSVIVDFNELDGGITASCDPDGAGKAASEVFTEAGYPLTFTQEDPTFVCRVSGKPAESPCVRTPPASAYWSLWWSDGTSGSWVYASSGVGTLEVPDGGYLAFAWHQGDGRAAPPDAVPTAHDDPSQSDDPPGDQGDNGGNDGGTTTGPVTTSAPTSASTEVSLPTVPTATDRRKKRRERESDSPSATASTSSALPAAGDITDGPPSDLATDASGDDGSTLPTWIGLALAVLVLGAAGVVTFLRRRTG